MSKQLTVIAHLRALDGQIEATRSFLTGLIDPTRAEPGCVEYWLHQDDEDPAEFTFYENWTNREEWNKHMEMPHLQAFADVKDKVFELQKLRRLADGLIIPEITPKAAPRKTSRNAPCPCASGKKYKHCHGRA